MVLLSSLRGEWPLDVLSAAAKCFDTSWTTGEQGDRCATSHGIQDGLSASGEGRSIRLQTTGLTAIVADRTTGARA
jgi:hypothetical protein